MQNQEPDLLKHLGQALRDARRMRGMTQAQVARRAGLDVRYYSRIEVGRINVTYFTLVKVSRALRVFPLLLLYYLENPIPPHFLQIAELTTHLFATTQRKKIDQLTDFMTKILGVKCDCPDGHCPTVRFLKTEDGREPDSAAPRGRAGSGRGRQINGKLRS